MADELKNTLFFKRRRRSSGAAGNILLVILGAVVATGLLVKAISFFSDGPVSSMWNISRASMVQNDLLVATTMIGQVSRQAELADCDKDGVIEPPQFRAADAGGQAPAGGGLLPGNLGVKRRDPWGTDYGYCVWDHGAKTLEDLPDCGGVSANRRKGGDTVIGTAIAVISAGQDKVFQTTCSDWIGDDTQIVIRDADSDDIMRVMRYAQLAVGWTVQELPKFPAVGDFTDIENANPNQTYCSGWITLAGLTGTKQLTYQEDAAAAGKVALHHRPHDVAAPASDDADDETLKIGLAPDTNLAVENGDHFRLCSNAPDDYVTIWAHSVTIDGIRKNWNITTRDANAAALEITPTTDSFVITGYGGPPYISRRVRFYLENTGESPTGPLTVSITGPYEISWSGADVRCATGTPEPLGGGDSCEIELRLSTTETTGPKPDGLLTVTDGTLTVMAELNGTRGAGFPCATVPEDREIGCVMTAAVGNAIVPPQSWDNEIYVGTVGSNRVYAAKADQAGIYKWGQNKTDNEGGTAPNNATSTTNGVQNTTHLLTGTTHPDHPAAKACRDKGAFWYLPAWQEAGALWANGNRKALIPCPGTSNTCPASKGPSDPSAIDLDAINIARENFWLSSQVNTQDAHIHGFNDNARAQWVYKDSSGRVRCFRREPDTTPPVWATAAGALAEGTVGTAYTATVKANDPEFYSVTYTRTSGTLPAGLTLNASTGAITGTPTTAGNASFTIRATDPFGNYADRAFTIKIEHPRTPCTPPHLVLGCAATDGAIYFGDIGHGPIYAAQQDETTSAILWAYNETVITGATNLTDGRHNTYNTGRITNRGASVYPAIWACRNRSPAGTWYLPAKDELDLLWGNKDDIDLASMGITGGNYWSSTEYTGLDYLAWDQIFGGTLGGYQQGQYKYVSNKVRCVRR